jgi:hypothetical protein
VLFLKEKSLLVQHPVTHHGRSSVVGDSDGPVRRIRQDDVSSSGSGCSDNPTGTKATGASKLPCPLGPAHVCHMVLTLKEHQPISTSWNQKGETNLVQTKMAASKYQWLRKLEHIRNKAMNLPLHHLASAMKQQQVNGFSQEEHVSLHGPSAHHFSVMCAAKWM